MKTDNLDLVYIVGNAKENEELRWSLRSIAENLPHKEVWIFGGRQPWLWQVYLGEPEQVGTDKWSRASSSFHNIAKCQKLSDNFILMNDDFFVMKPVSELKPMYNGTLEDLFKRRNRPNPKAGSFEYRIKNAIDFCRERNLPTNNYELHVPMIMNKEKLARLLAVKPDGAATRSAYGNFYRIGGVESQDVKRFGFKAGIEKMTLVSTEPDAFCAGEAGRQIRDRFRHRCKYERPNTI